MIFCGDQKTNFKVYGKKKYILDLDVLDVNPDFPRNASF